MPYLKTYLQISDLHFTGEMHRTLFDRWAQHVWGLPGLVGHTLPALRYLQSAFTSFVKSDPNTELIVTGDLTAYGAASQFEDAEKYLSSVDKWSPFLGLNRPGWAALSVPGNHDFWSGIALTGWGFTNSEVRKRYPLDAWITEPGFNLPSGRPLVFLHLNGDADVKAMSPERIYACGSFCSAVRHLDSMLDQRSKDEVRVLLLHHSVQYDGADVGVSGGRWLPVNLSLNLKHLTINDASIAELAALVAKHGIRLILTGHTHYPPFLGRITAGDFAKGPECWESCCGTTTQRSASPAAGYQTENGLVVHRIDDRGAAGVYWEGRAYGVLLSGRRTGFAPLPVSAGPNTAFSIRLEP